MQVYEVAVLGKPITQGSMRKSRGGHIVHDKADELYAWRQAIEDAVCPVFFIEGILDGLPPGVPPNLERTNLPPKT